MKKNLLKILCVVLLSVAMTVFLRATTMRATLPSRNLCLRPKMKSALRICRQKTALCTVKI